jgi:hypothetical protein
MGFCDVKAMARSHWSRMSCRNPRAHIPADDRERQNKIKDSTVVTNTTFGG